MDEIIYATDRKIDPDSFIDVLRRSTLAERRPVDDADCIAGMLEHYDLLATAWQADTLVGIARSVTDFSYCCYVSDLAVDSELQGLGVGTELLRQTRMKLGPLCSMNLLSAPAAAGYYPRVGFERHPNAFVLSADGALRR
jgi:GNAT superfamily N-acetyltransferase